MPWSRRLLRPTTKTPTDCAFGAAVGEGFHPSHSPGYLGTDEDEKLKPPDARAIKGPSPVAAIGVPACTANEGSDNLIKIFFRLLANIPRGASVSEWGAALPYGV